MAIADVMRLKELRKELAGWECAAAGPLQLLRFSYYDGSRTSEYRLSEHEKRDLGAILDRTEHGASGITWCWSQAAGRALKQIILERLDSAIQEAAAKAEKEAKEVLAELAK